jgi:hypothetical protein
MIDTSNLPLIRRCMEKAAEFDMTGDKEKASYWFDLAMKAEAKYAKHDYLTTDEYYRKKNA